jgi:hypothetical protein
MTSRELLQSERCDTVDSVAKLSVLLAAHLPQSMPGLQVCLCIQCLAVRKADEPMADWVLQDQRLMRLYIYAGRAAYKGANTYCHIVHAKD